MTPIRLAKRLAELISCSRREAELYIEGGWVTVDGKVVDEPQYKVSEEKIELHPEATLTPVAPVTMLFNQPATVTSMDADTARLLINVETRAADDTSGIRTLKRHFARLTPTLPLEANASGLVVLTQDWGVSRRLIDNGATVEQEYVVEVAGEIAPDGLALLNYGLSFNNRALPPIKVSWQNETRLRFALKGAQPGQISHMCASVGLSVKTMKRIRIGAVSMAKLPQGQWRYLLPHERF